MIKFFLVMPIVLFFQFFFSITQPSMVQASRHESEKWSFNSEKWSFNFEDCTVSEALRQINHQTGIEIHTSQYIIKKIHRNTYRELSVEEIITDMLRDENRVISWEYRGDKLCIVDIRIVGDHIKKTAENDSGEAARNEIVSSKNLDSYAELTINSSRKIKREKNQYASLNESMGEANGVGQNGANTSLPPIPEKWSGLEPPPMPPGIAGLKSGKSDDRQPPPIPESSKTESTAMPPTTKVN